MKMKITKLCSLIALLTTFCLQTIIGQQDMQLRIGEKKWPTEWPDSIITYNHIGERTAKDDSFNSGNDEVSYKISSWENGNWVYLRTASHNKNEYDFEPHIGVASGSNQYLCVNFYTVSGLSSFYLSRDNNPPSVEKYNEASQLIYAEGTESSVSVTYNGRGQMTTLLFKVLDEGYEHYYQNQYDNNGNLIAFLSDDHTQIISYDLQGRISRTYNSYRVGIPDTYSVYYYPDGYTPSAEVENNIPVNNNQGNFDLSINIPVDSVQNGSLVVQLPEGFTLDEANTSLAVDFAGLFDLTITKQENNSWLIEIKSKSLKSAALRADEIGKMLHIAYKVNDSVTKGTYNISVNSIQFKTPGDNIIPEPAITVPVNVNRWGVGNEQLEDSNTAVYITGNTLYIQTAQTETITIYAINGSKLCEATVQPGTTTIDASAFPQGVLIVKGSSGWVKKVVR